MNKILLSLVVVLVAGSSLFAQSVEQGKKFYYYKRFKSAKAELEKVLAANPNNIEATFWLGETLLELKDIAGAKAVFQKALGNNGNAPLILVGMGHVELLEGKPNDARQRFETALSLTKSKDLMVINAIGKANVDPNAKEGDANYAIQKLTPATQAKDFKDPATYMVLGDAYRKLVDGGGAITNYQKAFALDPKIAAAKERIGKIYETQGNKEFFLPAYEQAVQIDPNYAPGWFDLYYYWYSRDINKAKEYYAKYKAVADVDATNDYEEASIKYASKDLDGAISQSQADLTKYGEAADPRYYKLIAYSYDEKLDSVQAKNYLDQYFAKQKPESFVPKDYEFRAKILSKFPGNEVEAMNSYQKAIDSDTSYLGKQELLINAAAFAKKSGNRLAEANFLKQSYNTKKDPVNTDLYNLGQAYYQGQDYKTADSIYCTVYESKYPNEIFGYLWCARSKQAQDTTMAQGLAVDAYKTLAEKARSLPDSAKYKGQAISSYFYLVSYYNDIKKDKATAISYTDKILEVDPENADAKRIKEILTKAPKQPTAPAKKPAGSTGAAKSGAKK